MFTQALIVVKPEAEPAHALAAVVAHLLQGHGVAVARTQGATAPTLAHLPELPYSALPKESLVIILGGDGTYLYGARMAAATTNVSVIGVNMGRIGFLTDCSQNEAPAFITDVLNGADNLMCLRRRYYKATAYRGTQKLAEQLFLNEAAVERRSEYKMIKLALEEQVLRADGLLVATSAGSTAYALSAGGPPVDTQLDALIATPICAHSITWRPLVLAPQRLNITMQSDGGCLCCDGHRLFLLEKNDTIVVEPTPQFYTYYRQKEDNYLKRLKNKLNLGAAG